MKSSQTATMGMLWLNVHLEALQSDWKTLLIVSAVFIALCMTVVIFQAIQEVAQQAPTK